jgi:flagellar basal-body rod protein FlgB
MELSNSRIDLLTRVLDASTLRHRTIAQNVANVNTPGYQRLDVKFEDELAKILQAGQPVHAVKPEIVVDEAASALRVDGNNVDIDKEMGMLSKNSLLYQAASQILTTQLTALRLAISGR